MGKSGRFLGRLLVQLLKTKPLATSVLIPSGLQLFIRRLLDQV